VYSLGGNTTAIQLTTLIVGEMYLFARWRTCTVKMQLRDMAAVFQSIRQFAELLHAFQ